MTETRPVSKGAVDRADWTPLGALRFFSAPGRRVVGGACLVHWLGMRGQEFLLALVADREFGLSEAKQGDLASISGLGAVISSTILVRLVRGDDATLVFKFAAVGALGLVAVGLSGWASGWRLAAYALGTAVYACEIPANPALRALVTRRRGDAGLGLSLGAAAVLETLSQFLASVAYPFLYRSLPGTTAFFVAAASMLLTLPLVSRVGREPAPATDVEEEAVYSRLDDGEATTE
mmetsp:Transcript_7966/g.24975  ORF Transcript_7966/g.24975 Transcript_7966/m.24975 type:complete len:235 (+) Transcript_7966:3-707(+)